MKIRSIVTLIALSFLTFGVYTLFWLRDTRKELLRTGVKILLPVKVLLFPYIALIGVPVLQFGVRFLMSFTSAGGGADMNSLRVLNIISLLVGILSLLISIPLTIFWFYRYCQAIEIITNKQTTLGFSASSCRE